MVLKCSFCEKEITKDRFNIMLEWERQDIPFKTEWQKSGLFGREDICPKCFDTISNSFEGFLQYFRKNKGVLKKNKT